MPGKFYVSNKGVVVRDNEVLVLQCSKEGHYPKHWDFPGGRMEEDETLDEALRRELLEELPGIRDMVIGAFLLTKTTRTFSDDTPMVVNYYRVEADVSDFSLSDEHDGFRWVKLGDIEQMKKEAELFPEDEAALRAALA